MSMTCEQITTIFNSMDIYDAKKKLCDLPVIVASINQFILIYTVISIMN